MELELAEKRQYVPLMERSDSDLRGIAKQLDIKVPPKISKRKLVYKITVEQTMLELRAEEAAKTQIAAEKRAKLGLKDHPDRKPSGEECAIYGGEYKGIEYKPSPKVLVNFINVVDPGADVKFSKGGIWFHIFAEDKDGNSMMNCLPECLVSTKPEYDFVSLASPKRGIPIFSNVKGRDGQISSEVTGHRPRFRFQILGPAPEDAPFGLYFEKELKDDTD